MSSSFLAAERFAADEPVLVGSERGAPVFVAVAAQRLDADRLERLERLAGGLVVLGLDDEIVKRLELPEAVSWARSRLDLAFTLSIDATRTAGAGWSLVNRSLTMRIAADPSTGPCDVAAPGHVHPARIRNDDLLGRGGAAPAALELALLSGERPAVALSAVTDRNGAFVSLGAARAERELSRLPLASCEELHAIKRAERAAQTDVECELPTRAGLFRSLAYLEESTGETMLALVHGNPAGRSVPLVHVHRACMLADAFGSALCSCRIILDRAIDEMVREGAGVCLYSQTPFSNFECASGRAVDAPVMAGLLRAAGVSSLRLFGQEGVVAEQLRGLGLEVVDAPELRSVA